MLAIGHVLFTAESFFWDKILFQPLHTYLNYQDSVIGL